MSENKINSDSEDPAHNINPENNNSNEETSKEDFHKQNIDKESIVPPQAFPEDELSPKHSDREIEPDPDSANKENFVEKEETSEKSGDENMSREDEDSEKSKLISGENDTVLNTGPAIPEADEVQKQPSSRPKESNYQISLIDENLLKVLVTSKKGVKINSSIKENKSSIETHSNEIYFYPKDLSLQEVEVLIAIEKDASDINVKESFQENYETEPVLTDPVSKDETKSNFIINLINENLLKIKIVTGCGVKIDSASRDKKSSSQIQTNKIFLKQKSEDEKQEIEIIVSIDDKVRDLVSDGDDDGKTKLIPNPDVVDLIQPPDYSPFLQSGGLNADDSIGYKNPFDNLRKLIRRNVTIGLIAAVILHLSVAAFAYYNLSRKSKEQVTEEPQRLIVLQDLPDPKIKIEDVEDPNKPKIEEPVLIEEEKKMHEREITPRKIVKPPIVTRPKRDRENETKLDSSVEANLNRELDSLRKLREVQQFLDSNLTLNDSTKSDSNTLAYEIPDSLKNNFKENDIGLAMYFPKNWKLTDQRDINKNEVEFKGVLLTDTTAEQPGTMALFIFLDKEGKDYNAEDFKTEFKMNDSDFTAFLKEPKTVAGFTEYRFYIFNKLGTEKLSLRASVRKQFFDQYKNEIEAVVRSIRIKKKEDL